MQKNLDVAKKNGGLGEDKKLTIMFKKKTMMNCLLG